MMYPTRLKKAVQFASHKHKHQKRKVLDYPYITHPIMVMYFVSKYSDDENVLMAAVLHDTVEDTDTSLDEIEHFFGKEVAHLVDILSEDKSLPKKQRKEEYYEKLFQSQNKDIFLIKSADILYNMNDMIETIDFQGKETFLKAFTFQNYFESMSSVLQKMKEVWPENPFLNELFETYDELKVFYEKV